MPATAHGSLILKSGEWAYIPLAETGVSVRNGTLYARVRPSSGGKGKSVVMLDLAETVGSIIPGVLSSHLDPVTRTFSAHHELRDAGADLGTYVRFRADSCASRFLRRSRRRWRHER